MNDELTIKQELDVLTEQVAILRKAVKDLERELNAHKCSEAKKVCGFNCNNVYECFCEELKEPEGFTLKGKDIAGNYDNKRFFDKTDVTKAKEEILRRINRFIFFGGAPPEMTPNVLVNKSPSDFKTINDFDKYIRDRLRNGLKQIIDEVM